MIELVLEPAEIHVGAHIHATLLALGELECMGLGLHEPLAMDLVCVWWC